MTANAAAKKAIRAFAKYEGINYTEARTRLEKARDCWHFMTLGTDYDGSEVVSCITCGLPAEHIPNPEDANLECETHTLEEALDTGNLLACMSPSPIGDTDVMSCQTEYPGWYDED